MPNKEASKTTASTAQRVMKVCLIVSIAVGCLIIVLAGAGGQGFFIVSAGVIPVVAIQWFFYLVVRAKQRSQHGTS
jgi:high-affinity Fe2+/Pb2+ permease